MRRRVIVLLLIALAILGGGSFIWRQRTKPVSVVAERLSRGPLRDVISATGTVEARSAVLSPKVGGRVAAVLVQEGQEVRAGQLLVSLESEELSAEVSRAQAAADAARSHFRKVRAGATEGEIEAAQAHSDEAQAAYDYAEREARRMRDLFRQGAVARNQLDAAETALRTAQARRQAALADLTRLQAGAGPDDLAAAAAAVAQAEAAMRITAAQFDGTRIAAPFPGTVVDLRVEVGQFVTPGVPLLELADLSDRWVTVAIETEDLQRFRAAGLLAVATEAYPDRTFNGTIREITSVAQRSATGQEWTMRVKLDVEDPEGLLQPGVEVDVGGEIILARDVLRLPKEAVQKREGRACVFVWDGHAVRCAAVTTGRSTLREVEVLSGLREGDLVVVAGIEHLRPGRRVTVTVRPSAQGQRD